MIPCYIDDWHYLKSLFYAIILLTNGNMIFIDLNISLIKLLELQRDMRKNSYMCLLLYIVMLQI